MRVPRRTQFPPWVTVVTTGLARCSEWVAGSPAWRWQCNIFFSERTTSAFLVPSIFACFALCFRFESSRLAKPRPTRVLGIPWTRTFWPLVPAWKTGFSCSEVYSSNGMPLDRSPGTLRCRDGSLAVVGGYHGSAGSIVEETSTYNTCSSRGGCLVGQFVFWEVNL